MGSFQGFAPEAVPFFVGLEKDNSKTYWETNKAVWESKVHQPMEELLSVLEEEFPPLRLFRPNRDVRFSKDKSPYRLWIGAAGEARGTGGVGLSLRLSSANLMVACGTHIMMPDQLERFRVALDHDLYGAQFEQLISTLAALSLPITPGGEPPLKTAPLGYTKDHPRIDFLRWKGVVAIKEFSVVEAWLYTPQVIDKVKAVWHNAEPLKDWLETHVGPSKQPSGRSGTRSR
jgi:uncharacterized protein (TIGR02453 family)